MEESKGGSRELREVRNASTHFLLAVFGFSVFVNLLMLTGPLFMLQIYDRVLGSGSKETLAALFLLVGGLYALMALLDFARGRIMARFGARFQEALDGRVFSAVHTFSKKLLPAPQPPAICPSVAPSESHLDCRRRLILIVAVQSG